MLRNFINQGSSTIAQDGHLFRHCNGPKVSLRYTIDATKKIVIGSKFQYNPICQKTPQRGVQKKAAIQTQISALISV